MDLPTETPVSEPGAGVRAKKLKRWADEAAGVIVSTSLAALAILVATSIASKDSNSEIAMNVAVTFANMGKKVIFVDANLRNSNWKYYFSKSNTKAGLVEYIAKNSSKEEVIQKTSINGLHIIFSGEEALDPLGYLNDQRFCTLVDGLRVEYDFVIIDAPSIRNYMDASVIGNITDGIVLVVSTKKDNYLDVLKAKRKLSHQDNKILGVVLSQVSIRKNGRSFRKKYGSLFGVFK
jgi:capsular exopolysaccharide synthesis family protein